MDEKKDKKIKNEINKLKKPLNQLSIYTWIKDARFRFANCSENLCELANEDSPNGMIGKDDFSLIWQKDADFFREKDIQIIKGEIKYINVLEEIDVIENGMVEKQQILITKMPIFNKKGKCTGIVGAHVNLPSGYAIQRNFDKEGRLWLPGYLEGEYLTKREVQVLKHILYGKTAKEIGKLLGISNRTVEECTQNIKQKFQCSHKHEIHAIVIELGIIYIL